MEGYGKYAVYILASRKYGALYIGITGDLLGRVVTHREELIPGFTSRYHIHNLVYAEFHYPPRLRHPAREAAQEMAPRVEDRPD